jgi:VanZ family protein
LRLLSLWGPVVAWVAALFLVSSQSVPAAVGGVPDWLTHAAAYLVLSLLLCRALAGGVRALPARWIVLSVLLSTVYGITDEYHQSFVPERQSEVMDVAKDLVGAVLGGWLYSRLPPGWSMRREAGKE